MMNVVGLMPPVATPIGSVAEYSQRCLETSTGAIAVLDVRRHIAR